MEAKNSKRPLPTAKAAVEFLLILSAAMALFAIIDFMGGFNWLYHISAQQHEKFHKYLIATAFIAAALAIHALRRWLEIQKAYKKLAQSDEQLKFQSQILDEIGDGITATDFKGNITYVNQAQCDRIKKNKDEIAAISERIENLSYSKKLIEANVNPKFALFNLALPASI